MLVGVPRFVARASRTGANRRQECRRGSHIDGARVFINFGGPGGPTSADDK